MKARQRAKKFIAVILTLAMLITALPLQVFAYIPGHDTEAGFKNMYMHSAVNQRPIATYMYGDNTNYFNWLSPIKINYSIIQRSHYAVKGKLLEKSGDPCGNRTHVCGVRGRRLSRLTNGP